MRHVALILLLLSATARADEDEEHDKISTEIELITYDLADECTDMSIVTRKYLDGVTNSFNDKITAEEDHGRMLRMQAQKLSTYEEEDIPYELQGNWTQLTKCGDSLLLEEDYKTLITFANKYLERSRTAKISCNNDQEECTRTRQDVLNILATTRNATEAEDVWSEWIRTVEGDDHGDYGSTLGLLGKAATLNGQYDVKSYWEMLVDVADGYSRAESLWEEIEPLYNKLHEFVRVRINKHYNTSYTHIPVYLLGSLHGEDWSNVADIILPHPQMYHDIKVELSTHNVRFFYKYAENFTKNMGLGSLGRHFWKSSSFNNTNCGPELLNYCSEQYSEVVSCALPTIDSYIKAHEAAMRVVVDQREYTGLPQRNLRFSPTVEAVQDMAETFAINNLPYNGIIPQDVFTKGNSGNENRMTALLLTALRVLPKLAYYRAVDVWRLQELEQPSEDPAKSWWEVRKKYQLIEGITNEESDFLEDEMILYNKPYLSKFFGKILQFQFLNYHQINLFQEVTNTPNIFKEDSNFREMIDSVRTRGGIDLISYFYSLDEISYYPLSEFFEPLFEYLESAPEEQASYTVKAPKVKPTQAPKKPRVKTRVHAAAPPTQPPTMQNDADAKGTEPPSPTTDLTVQSHPYPVVKDDAVEGRRVAGGYVGIAIVVATLGAIIGLIVWKRMKGKSRSNNRRQDDDV